MAQRKRRGGRRKRSGAAGFLLGILFVMAVLAGGAAWLILTPYGPDSETFVNIPPGSSVSAIGRKLESAGIVRSRFAFDLLRWSIAERSKRACIASTIRSRSRGLYARIARGDVYTKALIVPEGANVFDIAARVEQAGFGTRQQFLDAAVSQSASDRRSRSRRCKSGGLPVS